MNKTKSGIAVIVNSEVVAWFKPNFIEGSNV